MKQAAVILLRRNDPAEVLLGYKKTGFGTGKFSAIGGKTNPGETPQDAVIRELYEETSVRVVPHFLSHTGRVRFIFPSQPVFNLTFQIYTADAYDGLPQESEEIIPQWFNAGQIPFGQMWPDATFWLPLVLQGNFVKASFIYNYDNETLSSGRISFSNTWVSKPFE